VYTTPSSSPSTFSLFRRMEDLRQPAGLLHTPSFSQPPHSCPPASASASRLVLLLPPPASSESEVTRGTPRPSSPQPVSGLSPPLLLRPPHYPDGGGGGGRLPLLSRRLSCKDSVASSSSTNNSGLLTPRCVT
jgi:hypothetical protein